MRFIAAFVFMVVYWPIAAVFLLVISILSGLFRSPEQHRELGQKALAFSLGTFIRALEVLHVIYVHDEDLRRHVGMKGPLIIACNHPALWDALLVMRRLVHVSCIMKAELLVNPLLRNGALFAGFLPNAPQLNMVRKGVERLGEGGCLLLFPEGTRTREENGAINPFRPGVALMAKQSGAPVLPVFISSNSRYLQKGWPIWRMPALPIAISLKVGQIATCEPGERVREFSQRLEEIFKSGLTPP